MLKTVPRRSLNNSFALHDAGTTNRCILDYRKTADSIFNHLSHKKGLKWE